MHPPLRSLVILGALATAIFLSGCGTSSGVVSAWADPSAKGRPRGKTLAAYPIIEPTMRQKVEDRMVHWMPGSVASYTLISEGEVLDTEKVKAKIAAEGFDTVVVLRLADFSREALQSSRVNWYDAVPYETYWGYTAYVYDLSQVWSPPYTILTTSIDVETLIFDAKTGKRIWASRTHIEEPQSPKDVVDVVAIATKQTLRGAGFIQ